MGRNEEEEAHTSAVEDTRLLVTDSNNNNNEANGSDESARIAHICNECEQIEAKWRSTLAIFKVSEVVCYTLGLAITLGSLSLSLLVLVPNSSWLNRWWSTPARHFLTLLYETSSSTFETNHLLVALPLACVLVDVVSLLLDTIQCASVWLTWSVMGREASVRDQLKRDHELYAIHDDHEQDAYDATTVAVDYTDNNNNAKSCGSQVTQATATEPAIENLYTRLAMRVHLANMLKMMRVRTDVFVVVYLLVVVVAFKFAAAGYILLQTRRALLSEHGRLAVYSFFTSNALNNNNNINETATTIISNSGNGTAISFACCPTDVACGPQEANATCVNALLQCYVYTVCAWLVASATCKLLTQLALGLNTSVVMCRLVVGGERAQRDIKLSDAYDQCRRRLFQRRVDHMVELSERHMAEHIGLLEQIYGEANKTTAAANTKQQKNNNSNNYNTNGHTYETISEVIYSDEQQRQTSVDGTSAAEGGDHESNATIYGTAPSAAASSSPSPLMQPSSSSAYSSLETSGQLNTTNTFRKHGRKKK